MLTTSILRSFRLSATMGSPAHPVSRAGWMVLSIPSIAFGGILAGGRYSIADDALFTAMAGLALIGAIGVVLNARGWLRLGHAVECYALFVASGLIASLLSIPLAATAFPLRDADLMALDRLVFGVDWEAMARAANQSKLLMSTLSYAYASLMQQPFLLLLLLLALGKFRTARLFVLAWMLALFASLAIFPFVPALGGYLHNAIPQHETHVLVPAAWRHVEIFTPAREGALLHLGAAHVEGIITFPSFHAAAAVMIAWAAQAIPIVRWFALALNAVMLVSTPLIGGHYIVDVIAGVAVALVSIALARRIAGPEHAHAGLSDRAWGTDELILKGKAATAAA